MHFSISCVVKLPNVNRMKAGRCEGSVALWLWPPSELICSSQFGAFDCGSSFMLACMSVPYNEIKPSIYKHVCSGLKRWSTKPLSRKFVLQQMVGSFFRHEGDGSLKDTWGIARCWASIKTRSKVKPALFSWLRRYSCSSLNMLHVNCTNTEGLFTEACVE